MHLASIRFRLNIYALLALTALLFVTPHSAKAQTENVLYDFSGSSDGSGPSAPLTPDGKGNFYGTTSCGGSGNGCVGFGTVFELSPVAGGWNENVLYGFFGGADGSDPASDLVLDSAGNIYGTATYGGTNGGGVVFKLTPNGNNWTETVLYSFCSQANCADGVYPAGGLIMDAAGKVYGMADGGVFELSPANGGWNEQIIYSTPVRQNGGLTMDSAGNIFGVGLTTAFELSPNGSGGWNPTVLHTFMPHTYCGPDVTCPPVPVGNPLLDQAGNVYGVTYDGGPVCGKVYRLSKRSGKWQEAVLYAFTGANGDGCNPYGSLVFDGSGNLYGTTTGYGAYGYGTVFELIAALGRGNHKYTEKVLWNFNKTDGSNPFSGLAWDSSGNLFGTTYAGGSSNSGVVFELTP